MPPESQGYYTSLICSRMETSTKRIERKLESTEVIKFTRHHRRQNMCGSSSSPLPSLGADPCHALSSSWARRGQQGPLTSVSSPVSASESSPNKRIPKILIHYVFMNHLSIFL